MTPQGFLISLQMRQPIFWYKTESENPKKRGKIAIESMKEYWYKKNMNWAWIAIMTLKLTRANLLRIKDAFLKLLHAHPELSAAGLLIFMTTAFALIVRYVKSSHTPPRDL